MTNIRHPGCTLALAAAAVAVLLPALSPAVAFERGDNQFPNSIMAPERGGRGRASEPWLAPKLKGQPRVRLAPGSAALSPLHLPRMAAPHPYGSMSVIPPAQGAASGPTIVPGAGGLGAVPNLPPAPGIAHETFQDRASRCAFQAGLYGVPNSVSSQYMSTCSM
jgi:hypothetical protein